MSHYRLKRATACDTVCRHQSHVRLSSVLKPWTPSCTPSERFLCVEQAVMVEKPKPRARATADIDTMGYSPSGMPAGLTM